MAWRPDYCSLAEAKSFVRINDDVDDFELSLAITAASRAIDTFTSRQFGKTAATEERTYELSWDRHLGLRHAVIDDVQTTSGLVVTVDGVAVDAADYLLLPRNAAQEGRPWEELVLRSGTDASLGSGPLTVLVEATWGWTSVPSAVKHATLIQTAAFAGPGRNAPSGIAGSPDAGSELRLLKQEHPHVYLSLKGLSRARGFA